MAANDRERPGKRDRERPRMAANRLTAGLARFWPAIHPHRSLRCNGSGWLDHLSLKQVRGSGSPLQLEKQLSYAPRPQSLAWGYEQSPPQPAAPDRGTPR